MQWVPRTSNIATTIGLFYHAKVVAVDGHVLITNEKVNLMIEWIVLEMNERNRTLANCYKVMALGIK